MSRIVCERSCLKPLLVQLNFRIQLIAIRQCPSLQPCDKVSNICTVAWTKTQSRKITKKQSSAFCREAGIYSLVACDSDFLLHDRTKRELKEMRQKKRKSIIRWSKQSSGASNIRLAFQTKEPYSANTMIFIRFKMARYSSGPQFLSSRMQQTHVSNWTL